MKIIPYESQKTVVVTFPAEGTVFAFFGTASPLATYCLDCCLVLGVYLYSYDGYLEV